VIMVVFVSAILSYGIAQSHLQVALQVILKNIRKAFGGNLNRWLFLA